MKKFVGVIKKMFWRKIKVVTHDSRFHADDLFAVAVLNILYKGKINLIRTRDEEIIKSADIVLDVGMIYDPEKNRFDHHQKDGAGFRENGIPYASFGLIWKHFGNKLCSPEAWEKIDKKIVQSIDAGDNGVDTFTIKPEYKVYPYLAQFMLFSFMPTWKENKTLDESFYEALEMCTKFLKREITSAEHHVEAKKYILDIYEKASDKRIIILDGEKNFSDEDIYSVLSSKSEVLFIVKYRPDNKKWHIKGMRINSDEFPVKKQFPKEWGGLINEDLQKISGVEDASFCHRGLFLAVADSLDGALKLTQKAIDN